jgi:uncharacterized membrane protein
VRIAGAERGVARLLIVLGALALAGAAEAQPRRLWDYYLTGTEPFWGIQLGRGRMHLQDDLDNYTVRARGPVRRGRTLVWTSAPGNQPWRIELTPARCDDGMSEHIYRYRARMYVGGQLAKDGCADPASVRERRLREQPR